MLTTLAGWRIDIIVQGYPGKSVCHGGLGWSTIALLRGHGRVVLVDVGSFGQRQPIIDRLRAHGLAPADVTDVLLTHSHWDHSINWVMFPKARVVIGADELAWSLNEPWGTTPVPELYVRELDRSAQTVRVRAGGEILPGISAADAPGHTPGHLIFLLEGDRHDLVFTGDAAKNRAEILSGDADMTYDPAISRRSIEAIRALWQRKPGTILVPGHDLPMVLEDGEPAYLGTRAAAVSSWFGEGLEQTTLFQLTIG
ncbi:MAG: MBL fold hydrolase [Acetobacteraceae bacterium SCN 69-10]|nr:MBL fold metallo-hydrolase [Rhodospirillales bacterium]ODU61883.1 MAG: MBL fold hydrolase [Acetobacteraceae bacterium SCN 69-10]OJY70240.1 MAG: MBL fold hydrolase [Rhodospirillales bacterium 70-18]